MSNAIPKRKIGWRDRVPKGWYVVKEGTYYKHIKPIGGRG